MHIRELSQTKLALGGDTTLAIITDLLDLDAEDLFRKLWQQVFMFEKRFSRFLPASQISSFNSLTGLKKTISPEFKDLLISAKKISLESDGLFNPFIIPALHRAGYEKSAVTGYEQDTSMNYANRRVVDIDQLVIGDDWAMIPFSTALDIGGCGKGYLADQLGKTLKDEQIQGYWLSLSGDVATMGRDQNGANLTLGIQSAYNPKNTTDWIVNCPLGQFATATSGTFRRQGQDIDKNWHHIIDPLTLKPAATDIKLATVCDKSVLRADVFASCAVILGSKKAPSFLEKNGINSALFQCIDENGKAFEKVIGSKITKIQPHLPEEVKK